MKRITYTIFFAVIFLASCKEDEKIFDKSSATRSAEAIAALKQELIANPWKVRYAPENGAGSFWVLMDFDEDGKVNIKSDMNEEDGAYYDQTVTYRIDSSLGLELIIESYSFFSFLFEFDQASFGAEYEFLYANKTPQGELVFVSKTDPSSPTILLFQPADESDDDLLGRALAENLSILSEDLDRFSSSNKLTYINKDLVLYLSMDPFRRTARIGSGARKSNPANSELLGFTTGYLIQGDSLVFLTPFSDNVAGVTVKIRSIKMNSLADAEINVCADPTSVHTYAGVTSSNDAVVLEPTIADATGMGFVEESNYLYCPVEYMFLNNESQYNDVNEDIEGVLSLQIYWEDDFHAIGFATQNSNGQVSFALKGFEPVVENNRITFNFEDEFTIYDAPNEADLEKMDHYLQVITEGNTTFMYNYAEGIYEMNNPCTGWSYIFLVPSE